ncbi:MAG TPA: hypothetical protein VMS01_04090 [Stellaceae bacterium]|nr:hypothetical protein [Stellaceae bacterium]
MAGIIELLRGCRAKLEAATKGAIGEAPGHIAAARKLIDDAEALIGVPRTTGAASAAAKPGIVDVLRRHNATGIRREALIKALGWPPGLVAANLNRLARTGRVTVEAGLYRAVEIPAPVARTAKAAAPAESVAA